MSEPNHLFDLLRWLRTRGLIHGAAGIGSLLLVCIPLEIAFRTFDHFGLNNPEYVFSGRSEGRWMGKFWTPREFSEFVERNADGIAAPELAARKDERVRVVVAGDSFVEGLQVKRAETFVLLADSRDSRVRLVPLRVGNHAFAKCHRVFLEWYDRLFDGDSGLPRASAVIYVLRERELVLRGSARHDVQNALLRDTRLRRLLERYSLANVAVVGYVCSRLREWAEPNGAGVGNDAHAWMAQSGPMLRETLAAIAVDARRLDLDVGVLYIPTWPEVAERRRAGRLDWRPIVSVRTMLADSGISFEDATMDVVDNGGLRPFFTHDRHPTPDGHRAMESALTRLLIEMGYGPER